MTRPMGPMLIIVGGCLAVILVIPFARRDDLLGAISFGVITSVAVLFWSLLIAGMIRRMLAAWRTNDSESED